MASLTTRPRANGVAYLLSFQLGPRGARRQKSISFDNSPDAQHWKQTFEHLGPDRAYALFCAELAAPEGTPTVRDVVAAYIEGRTGISSGTRQDYRADADRHIYPYLGEQPVTVLAERSVISSWVLELEHGGRHFSAEPKPRAPLAGKTIKNIHSTLSGAAEQARADGLIERSAVKGIDLPDARPTEEPATFLTLDELATVARLIDKRYRPLVLFMAFTGLRWAEATALRSRDISISGRSVRVARAWKTSETGRTYLGPPKSAKSRRTVDLVPELVPLVRDQLAGRSPDQLVFTAPRGGALRNSTFWEDFWGPMRTAALHDAKAPLPTLIRIHDLRHTFASLMLQRGVPLHVLQRLMGHESIVTTVDRYGHLADQDGAAAVSRLDSAVSTVLGLAT